MLIFLGNLAYGLMLCAFVTRDMLRLRSLLVVAQAFALLYAWRSGVPLISAWNAIFLTINSYMALQIVRERRAVVLPTELQPLYHRHFAALSPAEFLRWWRLGQRHQISDAPLAQAGERPSWLYFLLAGHVSVSRNRAPVVDLPAGYFIAEMSLMTGEPANADVHAVGTIDVMRWSRTELADLRQRNPLLWTKIQSVIGHDLIEKIRLGESRKGV